MLNIFLAYCQPGPDEMEDGQIQMVCINLALVAG
jgi:hypothetical protein